MNDQTSTVTHNDRVTLSFVGTTEDGHIFESSADKGGPCNFIPSDPKTYPPFSRAVIGMAPGEEKTILLPPEEAFGYHKEELVHVVSKASLGDTITPAAGMVLGMTMEKNGAAHQVPALVVKVEGDRVTLDYNHPLAGKAVQYTIRVEAIEPV